MTLLKKYKYNGKEFTSTYSLRQQIWNHQHKAYGSPKTQEQFTALGLNVEVIEYNPQDLLTSQQKAQRIRAQRDAKISRSDFYVMPDYPSDEQSLTLVKEYRQKLRDITKQETFPNSVEWPDMPTVLLQEPQKTEKEVLGLKSIDM